MAPDDTPHADPRSELREAFAWIVLGVAVLVASVRMDRLQEQNINPYTVPGLLPGLLGALMIVLGALFALRSWSRVAHHVRGDAARTTAAERIRVVIVVALCVFFDVVLVGHGLPFWAAAWIFVTGSILILQRSARVAAGEKLTAKHVIKALAIGLGAGAGVTLVFQELFLVRLP